MKVYSFLMRDSGNVTFCCKKMGILTVNLININLDNNIDKHDSDAIILINFWLGIVNFKNAKHLKTDK